MSAYRSPERTVGVSLAAGRPTPSAISKQVTLDGRAAYLGGTPPDAGDAPLSSAGMFDARAGKGWAALPEMLTARATPATCMLGSKLYVFGGAHFQTVYPQLQPLGSAESIDLSTASLAAGTGWQW